MDICKSPETIETTKTPLDLSKTNDEVIQPWYNLQKIIKEKITLQEIINKQEISDKDFIYSKFEEHYKYKLEARQRSENFKLREQKEEINFSELLSIDDLNEITAPIKNFLFLIKNNYEYIVKIVELLDINNSRLKEDSKDSIAQLLCHQFYNNIQIPNPAQEELLILCYHLLKKEISKLGKASPYDFLEDSTSFTGKFINVLIKKYEIKNFLSLTFGEIILNIDNSEKGKFYDLNLTHIYNNLKRTGDNNFQKNAQSFNSQDDFIKTLGCYLTEKFNDLSKRPIEVESFEKNKPSSVNSNLTIDSKFSLDSKSNVDIKFSPDLRLTMDNNFITRMDSTISKEESEGVNYFNDEINLNYIFQLLKIETDDCMKEFLLRLSQELIDSPKKFTNGKFKEYLNTFGVGAFFIIDKYISCLKKLIENIEKILKLLTEKVSTIPYIIRCISKIIHILISRKFTKIGKYEIDGFVGKFLFETYILPTIVNGYFNTEKTNTFISNSTRVLIRFVKKIISKLNSCSLFNQYIESDFTVLNHYLLRIIPYFHKFYMKLIDVKLPKIIENLISQNESDLKNDLYLTFDYFSEHPLELFRYQCICFSLDDLMIMINLIKMNIESFKNFTGYNSFEKAIQKITTSKIYSDYRTSQIKKFYIAKKEEENIKKTSLKILLDDKIRKQMEKEKNILYKVKQSIKKILKGLNMIYSNEYSYLNTVNSTEEFFEALSSTLEDLNDLQDEDLSKIPLSWYSTFLNANKVNLANEYIENDYSKLYQEILDEENKSLEDLKAYISLIFITSGMNIRYAEKFTENSKRELKRIILIERYKKIDDFIKKTNITICYNFNKKYLDNENEKESKIVIRPSANCVHNRFENLNKITDSRVTNNKVGFSKENHPKNIEEFIKRIRKDAATIREDINSGKQIYKIHKTFTDYMNIVKSILKKDSNFSGMNEDELQQILEIIKNHIIKKLYIYIFPQEITPEDSKFYEKTKELARYIEPEDLLIKNISKNEILSACKYIDKMEKSTSSIDKINCILSIMNTLNICIKFSTGKDEDGGADNLTPLFHYTIIKATPQRFYSNIYFMKALISDTDNGVASFAITQLEQAAEYISSLDLNTLPK